MNDKANNNFERILWGDFDYLHQRRIQNNDNLNKLIRAFNYISSSTEEYIKGLNLPKIKNSFESIDKSSLLYKSIALILNDFEIFLTQFNTTIKAIKTQVNEIINSSKIDEKKNELFYYNELKKSKEDYLNSKELLNKSNNKYNISMAKAISFLSNDKNFLSACTKVKTNLNQYKTCIQETKNYRFSYIQSQKNTIGFYKNVEKNEGKLIMNILKEYFAQQKILNEVCRNAINDSQSFFKKFTVCDDFGIIIKNFSKNIKNNIQHKIEFVEYNLKNDFHIHNDANSYKNYIDGIQKIRENIDNNLFSSINLEKEKMKKKIGEKLTKIFSKNIIDESQDNINDICQCISCDDHSTHLYFLERLTILRGYGKFEQSKEIIQALGNIFDDILNNAAKNNDFELAKKCIMISQTYFYMENGNKKYVNIFIKKNKWLRSSDFWRNMTFNTINDEISKFLFKNPLIDKEPNKKGTISEIVFSCLITHFNNMKYFLPEKRILKRIVNEFLYKFNLNTQYLQNINVILNEK